MLDKLKSNSAAPAVGVPGSASATEGDKAALLEKIQELEKQKQNLEKALEEWTTLAKVSACVALHCGQH